jgi:hypothetical protein
MHTDIHLKLHRLRSAELRRAVADFVPRTPLRTRLGLSLVALGLRLAVPSAARPHPRAV